MSAFIDDLSVFVDLKIRIHGIIPQNTFMGTVYYNNDLAEVIR
jgi:hypothetical protein